MESNNALNIVFDTEQVVLFEQCTLVFKFCKT
jgi:hypothetical protein